MSQPAGKQYAPIHTLFGTIPALGMVCSFAYLASVDASAGGYWLSLQTAAHHPLLAFGLFQGAMFLIQTLLWMLYRDVPAPEDVEAPFVSVVIPTFNEGEMVAHCIAAVAASDYPAARFEIIAVDDGSRDDTWVHMQRAEAAHPGQVRLIRLPENRGKRAALHAGFKAAQGEIIVTLDSDSQLDVQALRMLVAPLQRDARVGAVAGRVAVLNRQTWLGCMLDVQYAMSFDFMRAAQSTYGVVMCCPGALSAMRRSVIEPHLDSWIAQRFLGRKVGHGEDQALTNLVLRAGYRTVYQRTAVVRTLVPHSYRQLCRMLTRWDRSYIVESWAFGRFAMQRFVMRGEILPVINFWVEHLRRVLLYVGLVELPFLVMQRPKWLLTFAVGFLIAATSSALYYLRIDRSFRFVYGIVYTCYAFLFLNWIFPWALITVRDDRWGTR